MKPVKRIKQWALALGMACSIALLAAGCLQKDYEYIKTPIDPHVHMSVWDFIRSRPDEFSLLQEAISHAGMEEIYRQTDDKYTYLLINNQGMTSFLGTHGSVTAETIDSAVVRKMLSYHIIEGEYHAFKKKLPVEPIFVKTLLEGEDGLLTIKVSKSQIGQATNQDQIINGNINVNDVGSNGSSPEILSVTSNILTLSGPAHVFRKYGYYKRNASYQPAY